MAWVNIPNNANWQYDNNPTEPAASSAQHRLWEKQTSGIRTDGTHQVYTRVRRVGDGDISRGELSKSYWDAK